MGVFKWDFENPLKKALFFFEWVFEISLKNLVQINKINRKWNSNWISLLSGILKPKFKKNRAYFKIKEKTDHQNNYSMLRVSLLQLLKLKSPSIFLRMIPKKSQATLSYPPWLNKAHDRCGIAMSTQMAPLCI